MLSQFLHLGSYGRTPHRGAPSWSCIGGITSEGARSPAASNHIPYRREPVVLYGGSPLEAGFLAQQRAAVARDAIGRRLRCDGIALLAGVVSYPIPRKLFRDMPAEADLHGLWRNETSGWLQAQFDVSLECIVEHCDEAYYHLHFYAVPELRADGRLNVNDIHPGRRMKAAAAEAGAAKKHQDAAYRRGMERWQDTFHHDVSRRFGHDRFGPRRMRVSRRQHLMEKRIEEQQTALAAERAALKRQQAAARVETERERAQQTADLHQAYARPYQDLQQRQARLAQLRAADNQAAAATIAALRDRLAECEPEVATRLVA